MLRIIKMKLIPMATDKISQRLFMVYLRIQTPFPIKPNPKVIQSYAIRMLLPGDSASMKPIY
jgi:hypothetical protein